MIAKRITINDGEMELSINLDFVVMALRVEGDSPHTRVWFAVPSLVGDSPLGMVVEDFSGDPGIIIWRAITIKSLTFKRTRPHLDFGDPLDDEIPSGAPDAFGGES